MGKELRMAQSRGIHYPKALEAYKNAAPGKFSERRATSWSTLQDHCTARLSHVPSRQDVLLYSSLGEGERQSHNCLADEKRLEENKKTVSVKHHLLSAKLKAEVEELHKKNADAEARVKELEEGILAKKVSVVAKAVSWQLEAAQKLQMEENEKMYLEKESTKLKAEVEELRKMNAEVEARVKELEEGHLAKQDIDVAKAVAGQLEVARKVWMEENKKIFVEKIYLEKESTRLKTEVEELRKINTEAEARVKPQWERLFRPSFRNSLPCPPECSRDL